MAVAMAHEHPPLGAMLAIFDRGATVSYQVPVEKHLGRYFYAGEHRFHVADDLAVGHFRANGRRAWRTAAAFAVLLPPEEAEHLLAHGFASAAAPVTGIPVTEPVGPDEPTEHW
jgi:hypothetical protein